MKMTRLRFYRVAGLLALILESPRFNAPAADAVDEKTEKALTEVIDSTVQEVQKIFHSLEYQDPEKQPALKEKVQALLVSRVDMDRVGLLTLALKKKEFSDEQFEKFKPLFARLLFSSYIDRMENAKNDELRIKSFQKLSKTEPRVQVRMVLSSGKPGAKEFPIYFNFFQDEKTKQWRNDDIKIDGVSLVLNYRTQFKEILSRKTPAEFLKQLEEKVKAIDDKK